MPDQRQKCSKCKKIKSHSFFNVSNGKPSSWCKQCLKQDHKDRYTPQIGASDDPRQCIVCQKTYVPKQRNKSVFCSKICKYQNRSQSEKIQRLASKRDRICVGCRAHIPKNARADKKYCSEDCASKIRGRTMNVQRRIRTSEPISTFLRIDIYERDKWICQICEKIVNPDLVFPDPLCASLDHVIPLSRGGTHQSNNVQLAHLRCNVSRGNKVLDLSPRPSLIINTKAVFSLPEAVSLIGTSYSILATAVRNKRIISIQKAKNGTHYLEKSIVDDLILTGIPGSLTYRRMHTKLKPKATRVVNCKTCGKAIRVQKSLNAPRRYCSSICYRTFRNNERKLDPQRLDTIKCSLCNKRIKGRKQFKKTNLCSNNCLNQWRRQKRRKLTNTPQVI